MKKYYTIKFKYTDGRGPFLTTTDMGPVKWEHERNKSIKSNRDYLIARYKSKVDQEIEEFRYTKFWFDGLIKSLKLLVFGFGRGWRDSYINAIKSPIVLVEVIDFVEITEEAYREALSIGDYRNLYSKFMPGAYIGVGENQYKQFIKVID